jgi:hypothetical protein
LEKVTNFSKSKGEKERSICLRKIKCTFRFVLHDSGVMAIYWGILAGMMIVQWKDDSGRH